ncbi:GIY-YIG nuclease family protein [Pseudolysinimonas sp.]|jgi:putative endonuclease|uniref:GIY-YIG nuclease family protein n=1 Tax=Pseudolysinimonas sp. TaxID=2680009 RepID=UPI003782DA71
MPHAYILRCSDGSYYTGSTRNLEHRIHQHSLGLVPGYTADRLPIVLVFAEECDRVDDAWVRERQIHGWSRRKKEALIAQRYDDLPNLSLSTARRAGFDTPPEAAAQPSEL